MKILAVSRSVHIGLAAFQVHIENLYRINDIFNPKIQAMQQLQSNISASGAQKLDWLNYHPTDKAE